MAVNKFLAVGTLWNVGVNWSLGTVPTNSDQVEFDAVSNACTLDVNAVADSIDMTGYTNTLTQSTFDLTVDLTFICPAGTFTGGSGTLQINGDFTLSGGAFTAPSGTFILKGDFIRTSGTYAHNNGLIGWYKTNGSQNYDSDIRIDFYKIDIAKSVYDIFVIDEDMNCNSELAINNSISSSPAIHNGTIHMLLDSNLIVNGGLMSSSGEISFDGNDHTWTSNLTTETIGICNIKIDCTSLTFVNGAGASTIFGCGHFKWISGNLIDSDQIFLIVVTPSLHAEYWLSDTLIVSKWSQNNANFDNFFYDETGSGNGTMLVKELLSPSSGTGSQWKNGTVQFEKQYVQLGLAGTGPQTTVLEAVGSEASTIDAQTSGRIMGLLTINKSGGSLKLLNDLVQSVSGQDVIMNAGTFDVNGFNYSINDQLIHVGGIILDSVGGGSWTHGRHVATAGTITLVNVFCNSTQNTTLFTDSPGYVLNVTNYEFTGSNHWVIDQTNTVFAHMIINKCTTCGMTGEWYAVNVTIKNASKWGSSIGGFITGNVIAEGVVFSQCAGPITFIGTDTHTVSGPVHFDRLLFNKTDGLLTFLNDFELEECEVIAGASLIDFGSSTCAIVSPSSHLDASDWLVAGLVFYGIELEIATTGNAVMNVTVVSAVFTITACGSIAGSLTLGGDFIVNDATVSAGITVEFNGIIDQFIFIQGGGSGGLDVIVTVDKLGGSVIQLSDVGSNAITFLLFRGIWCTNEFDLDADIINISSPSSELQKTPSSTVTANSIIGAVVDVSECGKKNSILALL